MPYGLLYPIFVVACVWMRVGQNRENNEEHEEPDEDCVQKGLQLARVKFDRDDKGGREALGMGNPSINR